MLADNYGVGWVLRIVLGDCGSYQLIGWPGQVAFQRRDVLRRVIRHTGDLVAVLENSGLGLIYGRLGEAANKVQTIAPTAVPIFRGAGTPNIAND